MSQQEKKDEISDVLAAASVTKAAIVEIGIRGSVAVVEMTTADAAWRATRQLKDSFVSKGTKSFAKLAQTTIMRLATAPLAALRSAGWKNGLGSWHRWGRGPRDAHLMTADEGGVIAASRLRSGSIELWTVQEWAPVARSISGGWGGLPL